MNQELKFKVISSMLEAYGEGHISTIYCTNSLLARLLQPERLCG